MFNWLRQPKPYRAYAFSTQGAREGENEDNYLIVQPQGDAAQAEHLRDQQPVAFALPGWNPNKIRIAVADGMGGHAQGREASERLVDALSKMPPTGKVGELAAQVRKLHKDLLEGLEGKGKRRPGSTLLVADVDTVTGLCVLANVGDSRAYLLRGGILHQLSHDQIYCEFAWRDGDIEDEKYFPARREPHADLTQAMGFGSHGIRRAADGTRPYQYDPNLRLDYKDDGQHWRDDWDRTSNQHRDVFLLQLQDDDVLLLASDGLWAMGGDNVWRPALTEPLHSRSALEKLAQAAIDNGSEDNVTLVMCAKEGAVGGFNVIDAKTEQVYQGGKNVARQALARLAPLRSKFRWIDWRVKFSLLVCLLAAFWGLAAYRIADLHRQDGWFDANSSEDQQLFDDLKNSTLLSLDPSSLRLLVPESDFDLARAAKGPPLNDTENLLFGNMYNTVAGSVVRTQIARWNQTRELSAVRADAAGPWRLANGYDVNLSTSSTLPEAFAYVHQRRVNHAGQTWSYGVLRTEFLDWTVGHHHETAQYEREVPAAKTLQIQYVGRLQSCQWVSAAGVTGDCQRYAQPLCRFHGLIKLVKCSRENADAGELVIPGMPAQTTLKLRLDPVANPGRQAADLAISYRMPKDGPVSLTDFSYQFKKTLAAPPATVEQQSRFTIATADGVDLTDKDGSPSANAVALGLTGLIGVDKNDYNRLSYLMARSGLADGYALRLTIDSRAQSAANAVLLKGIEKEVSEETMSLYRPVRRGALVVLDADNGDVLASASFPTPPQKVDWPQKAWDKIAFSTQFGLLDPFLVRGWQGEDSNQAPGSSFKVFMALAAAARIRELQGTPEGETLKRYFEGLSGEDFTHLTGIKMNEGRIPVYSSAYLQREHGLAPFYLKNCCNDNNPETMSYFYDKALVTPACGRAALVKDHLGVAEALAHSSNVWFAQLAKLMDGAAAEQFDFSTRQNEPPLFLIRFMHRFDFGRGISLISPSEQLNAKRQSVWQGAETFKTPERNVPTLFEPPKGSYEMMNLLQTSVGQSLQVTPLQMAQTATLAATGHWLHPNLIKQWGSDAVKPRIADTLDVDFTLIRQGMAAVVQTGTADGAFKAHPDLCRIYGKTGTAIVKEQLEKDAKGSSHQLPGHNTAWFIGWREPKQPGEKKLAFACMVTHTTKQGGSVCAPIVADFLRSVERL